MPCRRPDRRSTCGMQRPRRRARRRALPVVGCLERQYWLVQPWVLRPEEYEILFAAEYRENPRQQAWCSGVARREGGQIDLRKLPIVLCFASSTCPVLTSSSRHNQ